MARPIINLVDQRFDRLIVIKLVPKELWKNASNAYWYCECDCGQMISVQAANLKNGHVRSCGCLQVELARKNNIFHGHSAYGRLTSTYQSWQAMMQRCNDVNASNFKYYGGRGIKVCKRWLKFENFLEDMGERPEGKTIDRIDVDGNYKPNNCRWATRKMQANNRRPKVKAG